MSLRELYKDLVEGFSISTSLCSQISTVGWPVVMSQLLRPAGFWSNKKAIKASKPSNFSKYLELRVIIDYTEIFIETEVIQCLITFQLLSTKGQYCCCLMWTKFLPSGKDLSGIFALNSE